MSTAAIVWDPELLGYQLSDDHPLNPVRLDLTIQLSTALGVLDGVRLLPPTPATDEELLTVHTAEYVAAVKAAPRSAQPPGHGLGTADNPVFDAMHEASALVAGASLLAADRIASGTVRRAANIAGGLHHAMSDRASGFCVYNDCALAIQRLLDHGFERIAYVDIDVHHGDGVQEAFTDDARVLTISLHQHPLTLWPGTGWPTEVGSDKAVGGAVNLPLPPGTGDGAWLRAFHAVVPGLLRAFRPQVLVTQHGADTHADDPLADLRLSVDGQRVAHQALRQWSMDFAEGRWLALGGGGYSLYRVVPRSWTHLLATVLDRDVDPATPVPASWLSVAAPLAGGAPLATSLTDGTGADWRAWDGMVTDSADRALLETRKAVFPLHGLDPDDPRD